MELMRTLVEYTLICAVIYILFVLLMSEPM